MKNKFLWAMLCAMAVSSCSQNELNEAAQQKKSGNSLDFSTYVATGTAKAAELVDDTFLKFTVYAYSTVAVFESAENESVSAYMSALEVSRNSSSEDWGYTGTYYWLPTYLQFYAYATAGAADEGIVTYKAPASMAVGPTLTYTPPTTVANQVDLIAASAMDMTSDTNSSAVNLGFKHILTQINFSITGAEANTTTTPYTYQLVSIKLKGVNNVGTFTYEGVTSDSSTATGIGSWSVTANDTGDYTYFSGILASEDKTTTAVTGTGTSGSLMLIPQEDLSGVSIDVEYKVYWNYTDSATPGTLIKNYTSETDAAGPKTILFSDETWGAGQNLRYNLTLPIGTTGSSGEDDEALITFTTSVLESWDTEASTTYDETDYDDYVAPSTGEDEDEAVGEPV